MQLCEGIAFIHANYILSLKEMEEIDTPETSVCVTNNDCLFSYGKDVFLFLSNSVMCVGALSFKLH